LATAVCKLYKSEFKSTLWSEEMKKLSYKELEEMAVRRKAISWLLFCLFVITLLTFSFYNYPRIEKQGYNQGVNDTLNNYTCTEKIYFGTGNFTTTDNLNLIKVIDYSKEGYYKVYLGENNQFVFMECVNSTLKVMRNKLVCVRE
jgi:hypothetical protein